MGEVYLANPSKSSDPLWSLVLPAIAGLAAVSNDRPRCWCKDTSATRLLCFLAEKNGIAKTLKVDEELRNSENALRHDCFKMSHICCASVAGVLSLFAVEVVKV